MNPDRSTVNKLLALDNAELEATIRKICADNGIDANAIGLNASTVGMLRQVLASASDADLQGFISVLARRKGGRK